MASRDPAGTPAGRRVRALLEKLCAGGRERGVQAAAFLDGELVVDAWAGVADARTGHPVDGETLFPVFSVSKAIAATAIHALVERGVLDYDRPIAEWWPEFGGRGKSRITLRHVLSHTAGLEHMPAGIGLADLGDWDAMCDALARERPASPPGARQVYHAVTFGWLVGEPARRATGKPFGRLLRELVCDPLGERDLFIGLPAREERRVARLEDPRESARAPANAAATSAIPAYLFPLHEMMNRSAARRACIPATSGIMSARAIARHFAALLPGGADGVRLLPPARVRLATRLHRPTRPLGPDEKPARKSLGYNIGGAADSRLGPRVSAFGHGGHGGAFGFADPRRRLAVGVVRNLFAFDDGPGRIVDEIRRALEAR